MTDRKTWIEDALRQHERGLVRYAARLCGDVDAARDVVQECFLRLCREQPGRLDGRLREWLYATCRSRAIDLHRKNQRTQKKAAEAMVRVEQTCEERGPSQVLEQREDEGRLADRLAALPKREQELVRLKFQDGLSYVEMASVTGLSVSHVGVLLHGAMRALRAKMARSER